MIAVRHMQRGVVFWDVMQSTRTGGIALAIAITAALTVRTLNDWALVVYLVSMTVAFVVGGVHFGPKRAAWPFAAIMAVAWVTVALRPTDANWSTAFIGPAAAVAYLVGRPVAESALRWLVPTYAAHAGLIFLQAAQGVYRPSGIAITAPLAGGLLAVGTIYALSQPKLRPLAPVLFAATVFTGSRWAVVVAVVAVGAMILAGKVSSRPLIVALGIVAVGVVVGIGFQRDGFGMWTQHAIYRLVLDQWPSLLPGGILAEFGGNHNTLTRIATEAGLLAGLAWLSLLGLAIWRGATHTGWWLLCVLSGLGIMDYYIWRPMQLAPLFWLLIGLNVKRTHD